jgi:hypothetical protein
MDSSISPKDLRSFPEDGIISAFAHFIDGIISAFAHFIDGIIFPLTWS